MSKELTLPESWAWVTIDELLEPLEDGRTLHHGWSPQCEKVPSISDEEWGVLKTTAIQDGLFLSEHNKKLPHTLTPRTNLEVKPGDILITCAGPRNRCGVPCLVRYTRPRLILSGKMYRFRVRHELMQAAFMEGFLRAKDTQAAIDLMKTGISDSGLNLTHGRFFRLKVPVAPLNEQGRIVAKIEELFSDLDAGVAALKRAKANLKRYRAAVLKAAVEGKLTEEWRAKHPANESASDLLARILKERRQKWESEQLTKFAAADKEPPSNWREKYIEPTPPVTKGLRELPDGWCWASINQIAECLDNQRIPVNKAERANRTGDVPYYGANGLVGYIDDFIFDEPLVLVVEDETFVGREKPFSYLITGKAWVNNHAHILRSTSATTTEFLNYALMFYPFIPMTTGTTARRKLTKQRLLEAPFALPPLNEQVEIAQAIEVRLSNVDYTDASIDASLVRSSRLRQSILKHAFEGKLVPQDPKDEPASTLLTRLAENRAQVSQSTTKPKTTRRKAKS
jgi:type I restriction enzyme S subunit